tara:strand:+ start:317 stop:433 length:117 start_codon:yes stop_codon:yes gene_type:complete
VYETGAGVVVEVVVYTGLRVVEVVVYTGLRVVVATIIG